MLRYNIFGEVGYITERQVLKKVVSMKFNQKVRDFNVVLNGEFYFSLNGEDLEMVDENMANPPLDECNKVENWSNLKLI